LDTLSLDFNQLVALPESMVKLTKLTRLDLNGNPLTDLSILQCLPNLKTVTFLNLELHRRYWTKLSSWKAEWLLTEDNIEIRRTLIEVLAYEKIFEQLDAFALDSWREYTLLEIGNIEYIYDFGWEPIGTEAMLLLRMICPSTGHTHVLRVPPEMESAEDAIVWVNHGIHPDRFAVQT
jgi:leucine-rich repeat protein SHOC2